jgi:hypothetical protein
MITILVFIIMTFYEKANNIELSTDEAVVMLILYFLALIVEFIWIGAVRNSGKQ